MATDPEHIRVRVVYALPDRQPQVEVALAQDASVADAIGKSGLAARFAELKSQPLSCAIFGRVVALSQRSGRRGSNRDSASADWLTRKRTGVRQRPGRVCAQREPSSSKN